jgi:hypothetical protein
VPERRRIHTTRLQAADPLTVGGVTLLAIERLVVRTDDVPGLRWCSASKEPWAVVVHGETGTRAIGVDGRPMALQRLLDTVAGLVTALQTADGRKV